MVLVNLWPLPLAKLTSPWVLLVWLRQVLVSAPWASAAPSGPLKGAPPGPTPPGPRRHRGSHHQR